MQCLVREIAIRYRNKRAGLGQQIRSSDDAVQVLRSIFPVDEIEIKERFIVLYLDRANQVLGYHTLAIGGVSQCVVDSKIIFSIGLACMASSIVLSHNHPSGNQYPSEVDNQLTRRLFKAAQLLDIVLLDHVILTSEEYYSFMDEGNASIKDEV